MKKFFLIALSAFTLVSCGNGYVDKYEDICDETEEQIEDAASVAELLSVMKQFRLDIRTLTQDYAEEAEKTRKPTDEAGKENELYERRVKAHNSVSKAASAKRRELLNSEKK
ncbi:MAG: hypothetical protein IJY98_01200 [Bacteroidaceae bacterium]|nr:hypothetical protein [Bacteroidales bacterium]MBO5262673.1 hypothetical protein [Bacteroidaceae bacterium]MBQ8256522.1 hypothetical protein [Bacteroidaceae bacterium]